MNTNSNMVTMMNKINTIGIRSILNKYLNKYLNINDIFKYRLVKIVSENDRIFTERTNAALDRCDRGLGVSMSEEEFLEELETW